MDNKKKIVLKGINTENDSRDVVMAEVKETAVDTTEHTYEKGRPYINRRSSMPEKQLFAPAEYNYEEAERTGYSQYIFKSLIVIDLEILVSLYFNVMNVDPENPDMQGRDRLILSKGHAAPALYATLAHRGFFDTSELLTLRKLGSRLHGALSRSGNVHRITRSGFFRCCRNGDR